MTKKKPSKKKKAKKKKQNIEKPKDIVITAEVIEKLYTYILQQGLRGVRWQEIIHFIKSETKQESVSESVLEWVLKMLKQKWKRRKLDIFHKEKKPNLKEKATLSNEGVSYPYMSSRKKAEMKFMKALNLIKISTGVAFVVPFAIRKRWLGLEIDAPISGAKFCVMEVVGRRGKRGILQVELAKALCIEPKDVFSMLKHLEKLELIVRHVVHNNDRTNRIWLSRYEFRGYIPEKSHAEDSIPESHEHVCFHNMEEEEADRLIDEHLIPFILKIMKEHPNKTVKEHELKSCLANQFNFKQSVELYRLGQQLKWRAVKKRLRHLGYVKCIWVQRNEGASHQNRALQFLEEKMEPLFEKVMEESIRLAEQRINQQIYRIIWQSGEEGVQGSTLHKKLNISHKLVYKRLQGFPKLYNVRKVADNQHKTMVYRYFANEFWNIEFDKENPDISRKKTLKFLKRRKFVLSILKENGGIMDSCYLRKEIYFQEGSCKDDIHLLDMKTSNRLFSKLEEEGVISINSYDVPSPNGFRENKKIISLSSIDMDSKKAKEFMANMVYRNQPGAFPRRHPVLTLPNRPNRRLKQQVQADEKKRSQKMLVTQLLFGYVKPKMLQVRILHEVLWKRRAEGWRLSKRKQPSRPPPLSSSSKRTVSGAPYLLPKKRRHVETAATVHVDILKKLNCISYLQLIGADEDTKELSNPVYYMKTIEELPQELYGKIMAVKGNRARRLRLLVDTLRRMKLINISPAKTQNGEDCYLICAQQGIVDGEVFHFRTLSDLKNYWERLSQEMRVKLRTRQTSRALDNQNSGFPSDSEGSDDEVDVDTTMITPSVGFDPRKVPEMHRLHAWQTRKLSKNQSEALAREKLKAIYDDTPGALPKLDELAKKHRTSVQRVATFFATQKLEFAAETQRVLEPPPPKNIFPPMKRPPPTTSAKSRPSKRPRLLKEKSKAKGKEPGEKPKPKGKIKWDAKQDKVLRDTFDKMQEESSEGSLPWDKQAFFQAAVKETARRKDVFPHPRTSEQVRRRWQNLTKYDDHYAVYSDQKSTKEKMFKRIRKNFSTHQTKVPVADRIKMTLLCPEDAYDFYATRKWLSFWNSDSQSQENHTHPNRVYSSMVECGLMSHKRNKHFYAKFYKKSDDIRIPHKEYKKIETIRLETPRATDNTDADAIIKEMMVDVHSKIRTVNDVCALWGHCDDGLQPTLNVQDIPDCGTIKKPAKWDYLQNISSFRNGIPPNETNNHQDIEDNSPDTIPVKNVDLYNEIKASIDNSAQQILTFSEIQALHSDVEEDDLKQSLQDLCNAKDVVWMYGWDEYLYMSLKDPTMSKRFTTVPFYYKTANGALKTTADFAREQHALNKQGKPVSRNPEPIFNEENRRDWLPFAPWMHPDGEVDCKIDRVKLCVLNAICEKPGISLDQLEKAIYDMKLLTPCQLDHICQVLADEGRIHIQEKCYEKPSIWSKEAWDFDPSDLEMEWQKHYFPTKNAWMDMRVEESLM